MIKLSHEQARLHPRTGLGGEGVLFISPRMKTDDQVNLMTAVSALHAIALGCPDPQHVAESTIRTINFSGVKPGEFKNKNEPVTNGSSAERHRPILPTK